jgi:hypothetical protein
MVDWQCSQNNGMAVAPGSTGFDKPMKAPIIACLSIGFARSSSSLLFLLGFRS